MSGKLETDPLFVGLTRPTMIFGVSIYFAVLNIMLSMILFIQFSDFRILFLAIVIHGIGYILCFREPRFMEIYITKLGKCGQTPNKSYYGANSYSI